MPSCMKCCLTTSNWPDILVPHRCRSTRSPSLKFRDIMACAQRDRARQQCYWFPLFTQMLCSDYLDSDDGDSAFNRRGRKISPSAGCNNVPGCSIVADPKGIPAQWTLPAAVAHGQREMVSSLIAHGAYPVELSSVHHQQQQQQLVQYQSLLLLLAQCSVRIHTPCTSMISLQDALLMELAIDDTRLYDSQRERAIHVCQLGTVHANTVIMLKH